MSFFLYSSVYGIIPYVYGQILPNPYNLVYNNVPNNQNILMQNKPQQTIFVNFQEDFNSQRQQSEKPSINDQNGAQVQEKKIKIKKRRGIDKQKELQSAKKNSESNIINQFFSYFSCRSQSQEIVEKTILMSVRQIEELQKIISIFYNIMKCMSLQRIKKYVNKKTLLNVFARENIEKQIPQIVQKFKTLTFITIQEITQIIRRCCFYFLRNISLISILASKRISALSKRQHLKKRRQLTCIVAGKL